MLRQKKTKDHLLFGVTRMQKRDSVAFKKHLWSEEEGKVGHHHMSFKNYLLSSYWKWPHARH